MGKAKVQKGHASDPHRAIHSRISYLYQAASYLALQTSSPAKSHTQHDVSSEVIYGESISEAKSLQQPNNLQGASRHLISHLRSIALKGQNRLSPALKHTMCKNCNTRLIDEVNCTSTVENHSREGKKPWADMLLRQCLTCGAKRRYPVAAKIQARKGERSRAEEVVQIDAMDEFKIGKTEDAAAGACKRW